MSDSPVMCITKRGDAPAVFSTVDTAIGSVDAIHYQDERILEEKSRRKKGRTIK